MLAIPPSFDQIRAALRRTRRRLWARAGLISVGWALAAAGALLLVWVLALGLGLPTTYGRLGAWLLVSVGILGALARHLAAPLRRFAGDGAVAQHVEGALGDLHDSLLASVQFAREWPTPRSGSPALVAQLSAQVARRLGRADLSSVTPWRPARRPWLWALGVVAAWGAAAWLSPRPLGRGWAALAGLSATEAERGVGPLVGDLVLTLSFPPHTHRAPRSLSNATGDLEAPKGTRIRLRATTLASARGVSLRFGEGEATSEVPLVLRGGRDASGEFLVSAPAVWRFAVVDAEGDAQVEQAPRRIRVEPDHRPVVSLRLPAEDVELNDLRGVPVAFEARDDFGLSKVEIVVALAEDPDHPERVAQPGVKGLRYEGADELDLSLIQAEPGDRLVLTVVAYDNNGVDGPQRGVSVSRYITVRSPAQAHYELSARLRATIELLVTALADRLEFPWEAEARASGLAALVEVTEEARAALSGVVDAMTGDPLTPAEVREALTGRLMALEKAQDEERGFHRAQVAALDAGAAPALRGAHKHNGAVVDELEQAIVLVEAMVARLALEDMAALTDELQRSKEKLRALIEAYRKNPNEALKARIMRDIKRLRARIDAMRERMAQLRQRLPEEFLNLDGLKKDDVGKGLEKTKEQLAELEKMLDEGRIDEALSALDEMSEALDELSKSLDKDLDDLHGSSNPEMQKALSELMDRTRDLMRQQKEISEATEAEANKQREAQREALEEELADQLKAVREKARRLREAVEELARLPAMPSVAEEELSDLQQRVAQLEGALKARKLVEALEMADRGMDHLEMLAGYRPFGREAARYDGLVQLGEGLDREIMKDLSELLSEARRRSAQANDPQRMESLRRQQQAVREQARRLQRRMGQSSKQVPGLQASQPPQPGGAPQRPGEQGPPGPMERIRRAGEAMRRSSEQLGRMEPGRARPGQRQAMSELRSLMEGLKKANKPKRAQRDQGKGREISREKVHIPGAEDFEAPAEFRQELLDAMKQKPTEAYREQVKRYYESLIR